MWRPTLRADANDRAARRAAQIVTIAATVLFVLLVCNWRPWDLFARGGYSTNFYDEQARSFLRGRLRVRPDAVGLEGFLIGNDTYLYFGPFLAIVRMPFALFGDVFTSRLTRISMIIGFVVYCTGAFHLLEAARSWARERWHLPIAAVASPWRTGAFVAAAACSPALFLTGWVSVYHETELWAATFAVWAAVWVVRLAQSPSRRVASITAAFVVAAILTRASVGLGAAAGAGLVALIVWRRDRRASGTVIAGCVTGFVIHAGLNWAKFGSLTALPPDRQVLTLQDPQRAAWFAGNHNSFFGLRFLPTTLVQYLRPDTVRLERLIPFVRFGPLATDHGSYPVESVTPSSSLTATATLLCITSVVGLVFIVRRRDWVWLALIVGAAIAAVPTFTIGYIANRYLVDMMPLLLIPSAIAVASIALPTTVSTRVRSALRALAIAAIVWTVWSNAALATWTMNLKQPGFTELRYRLDDLLFGERPPALVTIEPGATVPRDGVVGLAVDQSAVPEVCEAVYIAEQGVWVNLERLDGLRQMTGAMQLTANSTTSIGGGDTWQLSFRSDATTTHVVLDDNGVVTEGQPFEMPTGSLMVQVVNDDIVGQLAVNIGDPGNRESVLFGDATDRRTVLFRFGNLANPMLPSGDLAILDFASAETLCRRLGPRL